MKVIFYCADQNPHRDRSLGISLYTHDLASALQERGDIEVTAIVSKSSISLLAPSRVRMLPFRTDNAVGRLAADQLHPLLAGRRDVLWHYPKGFLPYSVQVKAKRIGTIADTILQFYADRYPQTRSKLAFAYWLGLLKNSVARFDHILTVSEFSKRGILEFCARYGLACPPITVTYEGATVMPAVGDVIKDDYVIHLASPLPHKKTAWLLETWASLESEGVRLPSMRLVGKLPASVKLPTNCSFLPFVSRPELESMIGRARALILPSEIEGFGLPALEAYLLGTPVVFVKGTAVEEVLGNGAAGGFDFNPDSLSAAIGAACALSAAEVKSRMERLQQRFSWGSVASKTAEIYRLVSPRSCGG